MRFSFFKTLIPSLCILAIDSLVFADPEVSVTFDAVQLRNDANVYVKTVGNTTLVYEDSALGDATNVVIAVRDKYVAAVGTSRSALSEHQAIRNADGTWSVTIRSQLHALGEKGFVSGMEFGIFITKAGQDSSEIECFLDDSLSSPDRWQVFYMPINSFRAQAESSEIDFIPKSLKVTCSREVP